MEIQDLSWDEHLAKRHNSSLLPRSIGGLLIGKSGCGKATLLLNLLLRPGWLDYNNLNVFGKSLFQPEYRIIKTAFEQKLPKELIVQRFSMRDDITQKNVDPTIVGGSWQRQRFEIGHSVPILRVIDGCI
jgi:ABC-type lipoprotein export system ATPase subunit